MKKDNLKDFFQTYMAKKPLFLDKKPLQTTHIPETIPHREEQIKTIANILAPALRKERPSNLFVYGKTGSGKTLTIKHTINQLNEVSETNQLPLSFIYTNCKLKRTADTEYRLIANLARQLGRDIPPTGLPTEEVYRLFYEALEKEGKTILLVLDEIDQLVHKTGDGILYNLLRINEELKKSQIAIIGISNDLVFIDNIDPRVRSSLSEEEILFPPYNALQIKDILKKRAEKAFVPCTIEQGVIEKCAAHAAREHGDARRAIELLRVAGEIAERKDQKTITLAEVDSAEAKIDRDSMQELVETLPKQTQAVLYALVKIHQSTKNTFFTGEVYNLYTKLAATANLNTLTQRRISDIISELDMFGMINTKVISKGRYGRTKEIEVQVPKETIAKIKITLEEGLGLA